MTAPTAWLLRPRAHAARPARRSPLAARVLTLALVAGLLAALPGPARAVPPNPDLVPEGVWRTRVEVAREDQTRAFNDLNKDSPLLELLVPDGTTRADLSGEVSRQVSQVDAEATYGLSDTWNLVLELPYTRVEQHSTVTAGATAAAQAAAARLEEQTVSASGPLRLAGMHRPVFSDRNGFIVGYGLQWPLAAQQQPWAGHGTLLSDTLFPRISGLLHYTRYPYFARGRMDLDVRAGVGLERELELATGGSARVHPGHDLRVSLGWAQEFGPVEAGIAGVLFRQGMSRYGGIPRGDDISANSLHLSLGFGNLSALEKGPVDFPYLVRLAYDRTLHGRNTPIHHRVRLNLEFYF